MFKNVSLYTNQLKPLKRFYQNVMELYIADIKEDQFTVQIGESTLTFKQSESPAFYHFAINIPGNQFSMIKYWLQDRLTLNRENGRDEVYFRGLDADSMYFEDPAGNIVELIARRKRDLFGEMTAASLLNISEVGIVTPFVANVGEDLQDSGIPLRGGAVVDPESLNFLGRNDTFIVLVPPGRRWYFSKKVSETFPMEITLTNGCSIALDKEGKVIISS